MPLTKKPAQMEEAENFNTIYLGSKGMNVKKRIEEAIRVCIIVENRALFPGKEA